MTKTAKAKVAKKKSPANPAGRPRGIVGQRPGGTKARAALQRMATVLLRAVKGMTDGEAAELLGVVPHDVRNLRAENLPGLQMVLRLVCQGRYSPEALINGNELRKLPKGFSTASAKQDGISRRLHALAMQRGADEWGKVTGLSVAHVYQLRSAVVPGIRTVVAFAQAVSADEIFFAQKGAPAKSPAKVAK